MKDIKEENIEVSENKFPLRFKLLAFILAITFTFQTLHSINQHTYTTGVNNVNLVCGCFGCVPMWNSAYSGINF